MEQMTIDQLTLDHSNADDPCLSGAPIGTASSGHASWCPVREHKEAKTSEYHATSRRPTPPIANTPDLDNLGEPFLGLQASSNEYCCSFMVCTVAVQLRQSRAMAESAQTVGVEVEARRPGRTSRYDGGGRLVSLRLAGHIQAQAPQPITSHFRFPRRHTKVAVSGETVAVIGKSLEGLEGYSSGLLACLLFLLGVGWEPTFATTHASSVTRHLALSCSALTGYCRKYTLYLGIVLDNHMGLRQKINYLVYLAFTLTLLLIVPSLFLSPLL